MTETIVKRSGYAAIVGRPNVGKSTLLNRILGQQLAITSHKAQTTRHTILGIKTETGGQVVYVDTPGMHRRGDSAMNRYLNRAARAVLADVDIVLFVVEALKWTGEDEAALTLLIRNQSPAFLVVNKVDRVRLKQRLLPFLAETAERYPFVEVFPVSAETGDNVDRLDRAVLAQLPEAENLFPEDQLTDRSERFFAAELLREQLTRRYSDEIPYALTVEIENFTEDRNLYRIQAVVWVERPGQKSIILGEQGGALKEAASQARRRMERFFDTKVHLEVWIKVKKSWSSDDAALVRLGYTD
jgi:GTP-binding protein Era